MEVGDNVRVVERTKCAGCHEFVLGGVGKIVKSSAPVHKVEGVDYSWWCNEKELLPVPPDTPITAVSRPQELWED